jgi:putative DNA primase/helicase
MTTFREQMIVDGFSPPHVIEIEKWHRFPGLNKDYKNTAGYCFLFSNCKAGIYGDWSTGHHCKWSCDEVKSYSKEEKIKFEQIIKNKQKEVQRKQQEKYIQYGKKAQKCFESLEYASNDHKYLQTKRVKSYGLKIKKDLLIMPLYNDDGYITTYQSIDEEGNKKFFFGGKKKGSAYPIAGKKDTVYICEGYATGATIHQLTGNMVLVACDAGNMVNVAEVAISKNYKRIIIAADNDEVGIKEARKICDKFPNITYVLPTIEKYDWNDHFVKKGFNKTHELLENLLNEYSKITTNDLHMDNKSTNIGQDLYSEGLFSIGMQAAKELSAINIPQYNFSSVLILLSSVLAGKIQHRNVHPSCFFVRVGGTSTGKTQTDKSFKELLTPYFNQSISKNDGSIPDIINSLYGPTDFASGPGLMKILQKKPMCLLVIDEMTYVFDGNSDTVAKGKRSALLELSTAAGQRIERCYSDSSKDIIINNSCVNMIGNATPLIFDTFTLEDLHSGLIQRFDFFCYDGDAPYRDLYPDVGSKIGEEFANRLSELKEVEKPIGRYDLSTNSAVDIGITDEAKKEDMLYSRKIIDECNYEDNEGIKGIISRKYDASTKYALIHAGATRPIEKLFEPLDIENIKYGQKMANLLATWKIKTLVENIHAGEFDSYVKIFVEACISAVKIDKKPTGKLIVNRRPKLKNLKPRDFDDVVKICRARKLIQVREENGRTLYEPIKFNGI